MMKKQRMFIVLLMGFALLFSGGTIVLAQDDASTDDEVTLEEIVVTGSRIAREKGFGQTSPVTVMGKEDISSYGFTRIEDILGTMPQVEAAQNAFNVNGATGTAQLDLRGLGAFRTLTLMNGHRFQPGGTYTQSVDANQIPAAMIERVEVLTGGASATYGADAVAGVVNFIMRKVDGVELSIGGSGYQHDNSNSYMQGLMDDDGYDYPTGNTGIDGRAYDIDFIAGGDFAGGRGNATVYATWRKNEELLQGERDYSSCALDSSGTYCGGSYTTPIPNFDIYPAIADADGNIIDVDYTANFFATITPDSSLEEWNGNLYNYGPINHYQRPDTRWSLGALTDLEINEHATAYLEVQYFNDHTSAQIAQSGTFYDEEYYMPLDHAMFPATFSQSIADYYAANFPEYTDHDLYAMYIGKRNVEGGPRADVMDHASFRIVGGVRGAISDNWDYDVYYEKGQTTSSSTYINDFYGPKITEAIDPDACAANPDCIPYNVFTYDGVTPEAASNLGGVANSANTTAIEMVSGVVSGDTGFGLAAGNINVAAGAEWREERYQDIRDFVYEEGLLLGQGGATPSLKGSFNVKDIFAEANIPLLADMPFAKNLTLNLAIRWSDHSVTGSNSTYRAGLDWAATDLVRFRANYNRAVRSPNIEELYYNNTVGLWNGVDPCAGADPEYTEAQCANTGIPASMYTSVSANAAEQYYAMYGGNTDLDPEKADTWTFGIVAQPIKNMKLSLDYWNIQIEDTIDLIGAELTVRMCAETGASAFCDLIHRRAGSYDLWHDGGYVEDTYQNIGKQDYEGIDLAGAYWMEALEGLWNFNITGTYLLTKETTPLANDPSTAYDCVGEISSSCFPSPKWRHTASATYDSREAWSLTLRWRYFSSVDYDGTVDELVNLGSTSYFDLSGVYKFGTNHDITFGINNLLDKEPPLMGSGLSGPWGNANTIAGYYDMLGRFLYTKFTFRF